MEELKQQLQDYTKKYPLQSRVEYILDKSFLRFATLVEMLKPRELTDQEKLNLILPDYKSPEQIVIDNYIIEVINAIKLLLEETENLAEHLKEYERNEKTNYRYDI